MPIYEYRCTKCGEFEKMQRITDPPLERCPKCRRKVAKLISSTSFQLKGSGWYVTDYARQGKGTEKTDKPEKATESNKESKTESKSEKKDSTKKETSTPKASAAA
jgi:putative FmdB family regulatory protein